MAETETGGITAAIIGGGAAGTLAALAFLRHPSRRARRVVVFDDAALLGDGVAYRTRSPSHVLNVRASAMSALPEVPSDFAHYAFLRGAASSGSAFVARQVFGEYLRDRLDRAERAASERVSLEHRRTRVVDVQPVPATGGWLVLASDGGMLEADAVLLATGNRQVRPAWLAEDPAIVDEPWVAGAVDRVAGSGDVLIVGMALTAVDAALSLRDAGHRGAILMTSAHGRLPAPHPDEPLPPADPPIRPGEPAAMSIRAALHAVRAQARQDTDWRRSIDALRPVTIDVWRGLDRGEQRRALRHVVRRWEVHRHRMAPEVHRDVEALQRDGRLHTGRGRVAGVERAGGRLRATLVDHDRRWTADVDGVILCTGPVLDPAADPLLARLVDRRVVRPHPLAIGLDVDREGRVLAAADASWPGLFAMGSLRKGAEWEATAIPEIRAHAHSAAETVLGASARPGT